MCAYPGSFAFPHWRKLIVLVGVCVVMSNLLASCTTGSQQGSSVRQVADVVFSSLIPYGTALSEIGSLGLQPANYCYELSSATGGNVLWKPLLPADAAELDADTLPVSVTLLAPADWLSRLRAQPGVMNVDPNVTYHCGSSSSGSAQQPISAPTPQDVQVSFTSDTTYGTALIDLYTLGLQLTNPCDEAAIRRGAHPSWQPLGQEGVFAQAHTLLALVTVLAPSDWRTRVQATSGVVSIHNIGCSES